MENEFEIYVSDLTEEAQQRLCEAAGINSIKEANWDVFPITSVVFDNMD